MYVLKLSVFITACVHVHTVLWCSDAEQSTPMWDRHRRY